MSIFERTESIAINQYRDQTESHKKMLGVMMPTFVCQRCKQRKGTAGRRAVVKGSSKFGYLCGECAK